ncbi:MAG: insulinase family protein [Ignavibacteria bacterium]|nr:insulinase family protein [Ignavibacteria bacterium]
MAVINIKSQTDLSGFYIVFKGSVRNEKKGWFGLSHLMEHLICHHLDDMLDDFDRDGIAWNAYTSDNEVVFYYIGLDEYLSKYRDIILKKLLTFSITEEQFENERKIVLEEYKDYFNKQNYNHQLNLYRKLYNNYGPIGLKEDLQSLKYQDIKDYFKLQFSKPHEIINVSRNSEFVTDIEFSTQTFIQNIVAGEYPNILEPYKSRNGKSSVIYNSQVLSEDFAYIDFICNMLGMGLKSPLYQEIREKRGLVYYINCYIDRITNNSGIINITSETSDENVEEIEKITAFVLGNPEKFMTQERFDIVKQSLEIKFKKNEINRYNNVGKYIIPREWQVEPILKDITFDKVMSVYNKYFDFSKFIKSVDTKDFI